MPPNRERRPSRAGAAKSSALDYSDSIPFYGKARHEPLDAEDRADLAVLHAAAERGYRLAVQCTRCGQWLVAATSVRAHIGPVCRTKAVDR